MTTRELRTAQALAKLAIDGWPVRAKPEMTWEDLTPFMRDRYRAQARWLLEQIGSES